MRSKPISDEGLAAVEAVRGVLARELLLEWAERKRLAQLAAVGLILFWFSGAPPLGPVAATLMGSALGASAAAALALAREIGVVRDAATHPAAAMEFIRSAMAGWARQIRTGKFRWPVAAASVIFALVAAQSSGRVLELRDAGFALLLTLLWLDQCFLDRIRTLERARALGMLDDQSRSSGMS